MRLLFFMLVVFSQASGAEAASDAVAVKPAFSVTVQRKAITGCLKSGGACLKDAVAVPFSAGGKLLGWKLTRIKKASLFHQLKFKEGDVITSANGESVTDASRTLHWMMELLSVKAVDLRLLRDGHPIRINYLIQDE